MSKAKIDNECNSVDCKCDNDVQDVNYKDLYIQTLANYQNLQKRNAKDIKRTKFSTKRDIILEFINVYDAAKTGAKYNEQGPVLIYNAFKKSLQNLNVSIIDNDFAKDTLKSLKFDDKYFYAVINTSTSDESLDGHINEIISDGFYDNQTNETLIHAKVSVYQYNPVIKK